MFAKIKAWWNRFTMTPEEKFLSESTDIVDLEKRMERLKRKSHYYI